MVIKDKDAAAAASSSDPSALWAAAQSLRLSSQAPFPPPMASPGARPLASQRSTSQSSELDLKTVSHSLSQPPTAAAAHGAGAACPTSQS